MKAALIAVAFLVLGLGWTSEAVQVQEGGMSFSLEVVRRLQELADKILATKKNPHNGPGASLCSNRMLPQEFMLLCRQKGGFESLDRLVSVPLDVCEICSFAACTGCLRSP